MANDIEAKERIWPGRKPAEAKERIRPASQPGKNMTSQEASPGQGKTTASQEAIIFGLVGVICFLVLGLAHCAVKQWRYVQLKALVGTVDDPEVIGAAREDSMT